MDTLHCVQFSFLLTLTLSSFLSFTLPLSFLPLAWFGLSSLITFPSLSLPCILLFSIVPWFLVVTSLCPTAVLFHFLPCSHLHHHTYYLGCTEWRCLKGVEVWADDAGVLAYVGVCPVLSARPFTSGDTIAWHDLTDISHMKMNVLVCGFNLD